MRILGIDPGLRLTGYGCLEIVDASGNIAYRLAYNALLQVAELGSNWVQEALVYEQENVSDYVALVAAIREQDTERAGEVAREITRRGQSTVSLVIERLNAEGRWPDHQAVQARDRSSDFTADSAADSAADSSLDPGSAPGQEGPR